MSSKQERQGMADKFEESFRAEHAEGLENLEFMHSFAGRDIDFLEVSAGPRTSVEDEKECSISRAYVDVEVEDLENAQGYYDALCAKVRGEIDANL